MAQRPCSADNKVLELIRKIGGLRFDSIVYPNHPDTETIVVGDDKLTHLTLEGIHRLMQICPNLFPFDHREFLNFALDVTPLPDNDLTGQTYQGGFRVWEGTRDLLDYLHNQNLQYQNFKCADYGCGSGLLGIYLLRKGAKSVHFLDFNREVLDWFTLPNVIINMCDKVTSEKRHLRYARGKSKFIAADWAVSDNLMARDLRFDLILSSETLYEKSRYQTLLTKLSERIQPTGEILIATKYNYFGNNGGFPEFEQAVNNNGFFDLEIVHRIEGALVRLIIKLTPKRRPDQFVCSLANTGILAEDPSDDEDPSDVVYSAEHLPEQMPTELPMYNPLNFTNIEAYNKFTLRKKDVDVDKYYQEKDREREKEERKRKERAKKR